MDVRSSVPQTRCELTRGWLPSFVVNDAGIGTLTGRSACARRICDRCPAGGGDPEDVHGASNTPPIPGGEKGGVRERVRGPQDVREEVARWAQKKKVNLQSPSASSLCYGGRPKFRIRRCSTTRFRHMLRRMCGTQCYWTSWGRTTASRELSITIGATRTGIRCRLNGGTCRGRAGGRGCRGRREAHECGSTLSMSCSPSRGTPSTSRMISTNRS